MQDFTWKAAGFSSNLLGKLQKDFQIGQLEFQVTSGALQITSSEKRFEEMEKKFISISTDWDDGNAANGDWCQGWCSNSINIERSFNET